MCNSSAMHKVTKILSSNLFENEDFLCTLYMALCH